MPITNDFSDCCLELPTAVPPSQLALPPAPLLAWHRMSERVQRRLRFILRPSLHLASK